MKFRRIGIVMASLMLAMVAATVTAAEAVVVTVQPSDYDESGSARVAVPPIGAGDIVQVFASTGTANGQSFWRPLPYIAWSNNGQVTGMLSFVIIQEELHITRILRPEARSIPTVFKIVITPAHAEIVKIENLVAHTPGVDFQVWDDPIWGKNQDQKLRRLKAPQIPDAGAEYEIGKCPSGYTPKAAWSQPHTSWPSSDAMYTVRALVKDGKIMVIVRSRQNISGYTYLDVYVLCIK